MLISSKILTRNVILSPIILSAQVSSNLHSVLISQHRISKYCLEAILDHCRVIYFQNNLAVTKTMRLLRPHIVFFSDIDPWIGRGHN